MNGIMKISTRVFLVFLLVLILAPNVIAVQPVIIENRMNGEFIGKNIEYCLDSSTALNLSDILSGKAHFVPFLKNQGSFGYGYKVYWLRFQVLNKSGDTIEWYLENNYSAHDLTTLYVPDANNGYRAQYRSDFNYDDHYQRKFKRDGCVFPLKESPGLRTYYVRLETTGITCFAFKKWTMEALQHNKDIVTSILGVYFGILLIMFIYNLFLYFSDKDKSYIWLSAHILCWILFQSMLYGYFSDYIWVGRVSLNPLYLSFHSFMVLTGIIFAWYYLSIKTFSKKLALVFRVLIILATLLGIMTFFVPYKTMMIVISEVLTPLASLFAITVGIYALIKKQSQAIYFVLAYFCLILGGLSETLKGMGILPTNFITTWGLFIGPALCLVLFSFGLVNKISVMKNLLADLNQNLENKVAERTQELRAAMEELEAMNENLQAAMEEMEALNEQVTQARDALWGEMQLAKKIQTMLLPRKPEMKGYDIAAYMKPADEVGGDYYDLIHVNERDWVVIGDVSGHGVSAGLIMMMVQTSIRSVLAEHANPHPSELLLAVNKIITENIKMMNEDKYMSITVLACSEEGKFYFSGLHQDLLIYRTRQDAIETIATKGIWIGMVENIDGMNMDTMLQIDRGDVIMLFTDGITEAIDKNGVMFSEEHLIQIFSEHGDSSPETIKDSIVQALEQYTCKDDVTMVILRRKD